MERHFKCESQNDRSKNNCKVFFQIHQQTEGVLLGTPHGANIVEEERKLSQVECVGYPGEDEKAFPRRHPTEEPCIPCIGQEYDPHEDQTPGDGSEGGIVGGIQSVVFVIHVAHLGRDEHGLVQKA